MQQVRLIVIDKDAAVAAVERDIATVFRSDDIGHQRLHLVAVGIGIACVAIRFILTFEHIGALTVEPRDGGHIGGLGGGIDESPAVHINRVVFGGNKFIQLLFLFICSKEPLDTLEDAYIHPRRADKVHEAAVAAELDQSLIDPLRHHIHTAIIADGNFFRAVGIILLQHRNFRPVKHPDHGIGCLVNYHNPAVAVVGHVYKTVRR